MFRMTRPFLLAALLLGSSLLPGLASAQEYEAGDIVAARHDEDSAPISAVTLYPERARVTRTGRVRLAAARNAVVFSGLPLNLERDAIQVSVEGGEVAAVTSRTSYGVGERNERIGEIVDELEDLLGQIQGVTTEIGQADAGLATTRALRSRVHTLMREEFGRATPNTQRLTESLDSVSGELLTLMEARDEGRLERAELERAAQVLRQELSVLGSPEYGAHTEVVVHLTGNAGATAQVGLTYGIRGARWSPRYEFRKTAGDQVELTVLAEVTQSTGENWDDVDFSISTARPRGLRAAPPVNPVNVAAYEREDRSRQVGSSFEERNELDATVNTRASAGEGAEGRVRMRGTSWTLDAEDKATVPADGRSWRVVLLRDEVAAEEELYCAPEVTTRCVNRVETTNSTDLPLPAGPADIFGQSGYIGTTTLDFTAAGGPLAFSLGNEEGISVRRTFNNQRFRNPDLGPARKQIHYDTTFTVANFTGERQTVTVEERVPVSRLRELRVEIDDDETTEGYEFDEEQGFLTWELELSAGETRDLRLHFVLDMPKDFYWQGM